MSQDLAENYAGAFSGHLQPGKKAALLIVDVVQAYVLPDSPLYLGGEEALAANAQLYAAAKEARAPIIFTNVEYQADGADGGYFFRKVPALKSFVKGSALGAFPPSLQPDAEDVVVTKQYASAFFGTTIASTLHSMGVDTVVITGFSTSGCVRATALDALQNGFIPLVAREACADRHQAPHEANLFDLQAKYAEVISTAEACAVLARRPTA